MRATRYVERNGVVYNGTRLPQVGLGIGVDGNNERCLRLPLKLGADNEKIFCDRLGLSQEDMTETPEIRDRLTRMASLWPAPAAAVRMPTIDQLALRSAIHDLLRS